MTDSFKDIYAKDKEAQKEEKLDEQTVTDENGNTHTTVTLDPDAKPVVLPRPSATMTILSGDDAPDLTVTPDVVVEDTIKEDIKEVLTEQREQSAKVLESVMKTNTKIANNVSKLVKNTTETNDKLAEAITSLTDKIELLEAKLEAIEKLEIPTPVVHVQMPNTKVHKEVHRDEKTGMISHITETDVVDDEDE